MPTRRPRDQGNDLARVTSAAEQTRHEETSVARTQRRQTFLEEPREAYRGMFPPGYREALRDEWPR
ncbi:hypothetical protein NF556_15965 [Ornithinimicrobium faecis]|uniref:Uncharacterized protein n=1 Tax=Ornithinimicrobium faecis TaxID=2934158 RepID=A0ABY4YR53_9MICO|nr:hypothetical protein [Ornithinimicrobium sp. HY1793]USQ79099.1 hypothetical protein NF556_15965 [Ornithinimicrobium sp. HY1793]